MLYPLTFQPIFKERVWGGLNLARLYGKKLPPGATVGESWEISDRPGDSVETYDPCVGHIFSPDLLRALAFRSSFPSRLNPSMTFFIQLMVGTGRGSNPFRIAR